MSTAGKSQAGSVTRFSMLALARSGKAGDSNEPGGRVIQFTANGALNTGDVVYLAASSLAGKSATAANYAGGLGVVVGGQLLGRDKTIYGTGIAATSATGQWVLVQIDGLAYVVAGGTVTPGTHLTVVADTGTAGRVIAGTTAGTIVGRTVTAGAAAGEMLILIGFR